MPEEELEEAAGSSFEARGEEGEAVPAGGHSLGNLWESIKGVYYSLEDRYYCFLDLLNEKIPVYKIIDPIDEIVPSFLLFIVLIILFIIGCLLLLFFLVSPLLWVNSTFRVVDSEMNFIPHVAAKMAYNGVQETVEADAFGEFELALAGGVVRAEVEQEGFKPYSKEIEVNPKEINYIVLEEAPPESKKIYFMIQDTQGRTISKAIDLDFACTGGGAPPPRHIKEGADAGRFDLDIMLACVVLTANVKNVAGFEDKRESIEVERVSSVRIILSPKATYGQLSVLVKDAVSGGPVANAGLKLYRASTPSDILEKQGDSDVTGSKVFSEILSGTYYVRAEAEGYETKKSSEIEITPGRLSRVEIELEPAEGIPSKMLLEFVDKATKQPIGGVSVMLFEDNAKLTLAQTAADGRVEFRNLSEDSNYAIAAAHPEYVLKVVEGLPLIKANENTAKTIEMEKATEANSGAIEVEVKDYLGEVVAAASVYLYDERYGFALADGTTNGNGLVAFNNMPRGSYHAYATKMDSEGRSAKGALKAGETLRLDIVLVLGKGSLVVEVSDDGGKSIEGALVTFRDSITQEKLAEETTTSGGKTPEVDFKIDKRPYIVVAKPGYFTAVLPEQEIQLNKTRRIKAVLHADGSVEIISPTPAFDELGIELVSVLTAEGKQATKLEDNQSYIFEFRLQLPTNKFSDVASFVRAGLEKDIRAEESVIVIKDVEKALASTVFSACYREGNDYADCEVTGGDAKQVVLDYGAPQAAEYYFMVKAFIKEVPEEKEASTYIELRYGARGTEAGNNVVKGPYIWRYPLGPIKPGIFFEMELEDPSGEIYSKRVKLGDAPVAILSERDYILHYRIYNQSGEDFKALTLTITNSNSALKLAYQTLEVRDFEAGALLANSLRFSAPTPSALTELTLSLNAGRPDASSSATFTVSALLQLLIELYPPSLTSGQINNVAVIVKDNAGSAVEGATINVYLYDWRLDMNQHQPLMTSFNNGKTDAKGNYALEFPAMNYDSAEPPTYWVTAEKTGYRKAHARTEVSQGWVLVRGVLECIEFSGSEFEVSRGAAVEFEITNKDCGAAVDVELGSCAEGNDYCEAGASDISIAAPKKFTLENGKKKKVKIITGDYLGIHPVFVRARLLGESSWRLIEIVSIRINPASGGYLNCFEIEGNNYVYDVFHNDAEGTLINRCYTGYDDEHYIKMFLNISSGSDILLDKAIKSAAGSTKEVQFTVVNRGIHGEKYVLMTVQDYVRGGK